MYTLYYTPGSCSLAVHIALQDLGFPHTIERVLKDKKTDKGTDFLSVNPHGYVPALRLENGEVLTECAAILQYLADKSGNNKAIPPFGSMARYRMTEWLNFIATELHKNIGSLFNKEMPDAWKTIIHERIQKRLDIVERQMTGKSFSFGENFTIADAYLFTVLRWCNWVGVDLAKWSNLSAYYKRLSDYPPIGAAMTAQGIKA